MNNLIQFIKVNRAVFKFCLLLVLVVALAGCSGFSNVKLATKIAKKKIVEKFKKDHLKKKIGIAAFENRTAFVSHGIEKDIHDKIVEVMAKDCSTVIVKQANHAKESFLTTIPVNSKGKTDNLVLALLGREQGMNAIVTGGLMDVREKQKERGLLWFKDVHDYVEIVIAIEVYDTETGAKLMDESYLYEDEIDASDVELIRNNRPVEIQSITEAILKATESLGEKICLAVLQSEWKSFIQSVSGDKIRLASGSDVGLQPGDILEVTDNKKTMTGLNGEIFYVPGIKKGEIKITTVYPESAEAAVIINKDIRTGDSVKLKE